MAKPAAVPVLAKGANPTLATVMRWMVPQLYFPQERLYSAPSVLSYPRPYTIPAQRKYECRNLSCSSRGVTLCADGRCLRRSSLRPGALAAGRATSPVRVEGGRWDRRRRSSVRQHACTGPGRCLLRQHWPAPDAGCWRCPVGAELGGGVVGSGARQLPATDHDTLQHGRWARSPPDGSD